MIDGGWPGVSAAAVGLLAEPVGAPVNDLILDMKHAAAGQSYLEWVRFRNAAELHTQLVMPDAMSDRRCLDSLSQCATRIAVVHSITQSAAERLIETAVALRDRLPLVAECLRDGLITARDVRTIVERTDLVIDSEYQSTVDADVAESLRRGGSWSANRLRDMIDRIVFRVDPAAVRRRRKQALDARGFWFERREDGMAQVSTTLTAERAIALARRVEALSACVCTGDPRSKSARQSDAHFSLVMGVAWECLCGSANCEAEPVADATGPAHRDVPGAAGSRSVIHVICDLETAAGDGESPAFIDGYGVVSADHLRDMMADPSVRIRPIGAEDAPLPSTQPADPYRPSTALDTMLRTRSLYCDTPGCNQPAWRIQLDHIDEYDHEDPTAGGQTCPDGMGGKCPFHHNTKTFTEFLDDLTVDQNGRAETTTVTPEGLIVPGPAFTGDDLFPSLRDIEFEKPTHAPPAANPETGHEPTRRRTRLADKYARRKYERACNQKALDEAAAAAAAAPPAPPVEHRDPSPADYGFDDDGEPPF